MNRSLTLHDWIPFNQPNMKASQLTDAQLNAAADRVAHEFMATEHGHPAHDRLELTYDLLVKELQFRGMWS